MYYIKLSLDKYEYVISFDNIETLSLFKTYYNNYNINECEECNEYHEYIKCVTKDNYKDIIKQVENKLIENDYITSVTNNIGLYKIIINNTITKNIDILKLDEHEYNSLYNSSPILSDELLYKLEENTIYYCLINDKDIISKKFTILGKCEKKIYGYNFETNSWHCTKCGIDMGEHNPRQLCMKYYCDNDI